MKVSFIGSFRYAFQGILQFFRAERNGQRQALIGVLVILAGLYFHITKWEWIACIVCIILVIGLEMVNSAIEKTCNLITTDIHPQVKIIKDVAAGAVLFCAIGAAVVGLIIFLPYLVDSCQLLVTRKSF